MIYFIEQQVKKYLTTWKYGCQSCQPALKNIIMVCGKYESLTVANKHGFLGARVIACGHITVANCNFCISTNKMVSYIHINVTYKVQASI